ncbi:MAG: preprotein translocase subunit SecE [Verrucomicrobia bacterium]|nr:preprotein translocase subunit SecE [Verrucomicrobiota bacterium]
MENRKTVSKNRKSIFTYIQELKDELKKVTWTNREELQFSTKMVVLATIFFGLGIYLIDFFIKSSLDSIRAVLNFIFG